MSSLRGSLKAKVASSVLSITTALWLGGMGYFLPVAANAVTADELQAQIQSLLAQIATLQSQLAGLSGGGTSGFSHVFNTNLSQGMDNSEVAALQQALDLEGCFTFASYTGYFGSITRDGVNCFQNKYASEVLTPLGLTGATGYVGPGTRAKLNALYGTGGTGTGTGTGTVPSGSDTLTVVAGQQPADSLAVDNAQGLPFTVFTATAGGSDVTIDSVTVERQGLAADASFSGVVLLDGDGLRIGLSKSFNSVHQAVLSEDVVVKAGMTKTFTVAADMAADNATRVGETPLMAVTAIKLTGNTTLNASLPIKGAIHTINASLVIGSLTMSIGPLDPGSSVNKKVGDANGYTFSSIKMTAGSAEDVSLKNIRWNQSGSVASSDLANTKIVVNGTEYAAVVSSDGKYYSANFGDGISIEKGFSAEISIKGDIISGSGRTVDFDVFRRTDLTVKGKIFGYNITPPNGADDSGTDDGQFHLDTNPWFDAYQVTIDTGTITVENSTEVPAQNIAENVVDQVIGGFNVDTKGEPISVGQIIFNLSGPTGSTDTTAADVTNIVLVRKDTNTTVAGPQDGSSSANTVTFTETVIFPVGKHTYVLKGKLGTDFDNNNTIAASTTPSTQWTSVTGQTTGVSITPAPTSAVTGNLMTLKAAVVTLSVQSTPIAQDLVAGSNQFLFANYELDATNSGDDIKFASIPLEYGRYGTAVTDVTACKLYDGAAAVSEEVNPSAVGSSTSFTFLGTGFTVPKGTAKVLGLKCNVSSGAPAASRIQWGYSNAGAAAAATGIQSGQSATVTENGGSGQIMTVQSGGTYTVVNDSTPGYRIANAGTTGVVLLRLKFSASFESLNVKRVNFQLTGTASNTPVDLASQQVTLWDVTANKQIATAIFGSNSDYATSTLIADGDFMIAKDGSRTLEVKGDMSGIGVSGPSTESGHLMLVNWDGDADGLTGGNYAVGVGSATNITPSGNDTALTAGVRIMKAYPSFTKIDLTTSERILKTGSDRTFYKFKVTAVGGDVEFYKFTFQISSSTGSIAKGTTSKYSLYAYTDSGFSTVDSAFSASGILNADQCYYPGAQPANWGAGNPNTRGIHDVDIELFMDSSATTCGDTNTSTTTYKVPSGLTRYFRFAADVASVETVTGTESMEVDLRGDAAYQTVVCTTGGCGVGMSTAELGRATVLDTNTNDDLIWSPRSTSTTNALTDVDFTNGYEVPGLPATRMAHEVMTSEN
ncbi:MAG: hypothetical protein HY445_01225 [Candidatus Niyogibacteria bacterium]|nr:hypothetical protein [Candidatus Niyogibacteria bacterium]